jgi:hypothetical protein
MLGASGMPGGIDLRPGASGWNRPDERAAVAGIFTVEDAPMAVIPVVVPEPADDTCVAGHRGSWVREALASRGVMAGHGGGVT